MMIDLKKSGVAIPFRVVENLRVAKSLIELSCMDGRGDAIQNAEALLVGVEAYLVAEGQKRFDADMVDGWIRRLERVNTEPPLVVAGAVKQFVVGVPKDQQWIRIEPVDALTVKRVEQLVAHLGLQTKVQSDGKLVVYGSPERLRRFIREITPENSNKISI